MTQIERHTLRVETLIKAGSVLIGCITISLTIGITIGDWKMWRKQTDDRITEVEKDTKAFKNAQYIYGGKTSANRTITNH